MYSLSLTARTRPSVSINLSNKSHCNSVFVFSVATVILSSATTPLLSTNSLPKCFRFAFKLVRLINQNMPPMNAAAIPRNKNVYGHDVSMAITFTAMAVTTMIVVTPEIDHILRGKIMRSTLRASSKLIHPLNGIGSIFIPRTPTFTIWLRSGATIARIVWFAFYGFIDQAIFRVNRLPMASANFSNVESLMSSA